MVMRDEAANHLHELQDPVLVLPRETHENLRVLLHLFALISFLIVVTIVQLNEYSAKQPNDHHENHCQALFLRRHLVLKINPIQSFDSHCQSSTNLVQEKYYGISHYHR